MSNTVRSNDTMTQHDTDYAQHLTETTQGGCTSVVPQQAKQLQTNLLL